MSGPNQRGNEEIFQTHGMLASPKEARTSYTVEEAATLLGKKPYTVRQWCLEGRINATKRAERRGGSEVWNISAVEIDRYRNEGLLPVMRARLAG
jgi:hypothetical protein